MADSPEMDYPEGQQPLAAEVLAFLTAPAGDPPSVSDAIARAGASGLRLGDWSIVPLTGGAIEKWKASVQTLWEDEREPVAYEIWLQRLTGLEDWHFEGNDMDDDERARARQSAWAIGIGSPLGPAPLAAYHRLLRVAAATVPDAPATLDVTSCVMRSGRWLREVAACDVPPHPRNLFSIHMVYDEACGGVDELHWLHTHGLLRCGSIEFEMIDIPRCLTDLSIELLESVCVSAIEHGSGPPREPFSPGDDITLEWIPWPDAARRFTGRVGARTEDRDDYHRLPSGVLVERRGRWLWRRYDSPRHALKILGDNPVLYISDGETNRMERMARGRFDRFRRVFARRRGWDGWTFFIKFGYPVERSRGGSPDREHLWFECLDLDERRALGRLVNDPRKVSSLSKGQAGWHELERMTDWHIQTPAQRYDPDSIVSITEPLDGG